MSRLSDVEGVGGPGRAPAFQCRRCGACCLGRGGARLDEAGTRAAAAFLGLAEADFRRLYLTPGGQAPVGRDIGLDESGRCLFRQPGGLCLIHPVKPETCRLWPFLSPLLTRESAFQEARCACPGFRDDLTWAEFKAAGSPAG